MIDTTRQNGPRAQRLEIEAEIAAFAPDYRALVLRVVEAAREGADLLAVFGASSITAARETGRARMLADRMYAALAAIDAAPSGDDGPHD